MIEEISFQTKRELKSICLNPKETAEFKLQFTLGKLFRGQSVVKLAFNDIMTDQEFGQTFEVTIEGIASEIAPRNKGKKGINNGINVINLEELERG